jgi:hypothetical protein
MEQFYSPKSLATGQITEIPQELLERSFKADTPNTTGTAYYSPLDLIIFFGPLMALAYRLVPFHRGPQNSRFPAPTPPPLPQVKYLPASKTLRTGPYKS